MDVGRLVSLFTVVIVCLCGSRQCLGGSVSHFILGGTAAQDGKYPWQLSFQRQSNGNGWTHTCGAVLIAEKFALTAGHCVYNRTKKLPDGSFPSYRVSDMRIVAGATRISPMDQDAETRKFKRVITPYGLSVFFDVALIEFDRVLDTSRADITPITISNSTEPPTTRNCMISGWGTVDRNTPRASPILREAPTKIVSLEECQRSGWPVVPTHVCASGFSKAVTGCFGDSGGPLTCYREDDTPVLMGISSFVYHRCRTSRPNVFSRAAIYRKWIRRLTQLDNI